MADTPSLSTLFTNIANAIRTKKGATGAIAASSFPTEISSIQTGSELTGDATATAADILSGKTAYAKGAKLTGTIAGKTASDLTASGATVTVPAGHYASQATKSVATAAQATPSISVDAAGKITASATQTAGYVSGGTKSATQQLTTQAAATITPGTSAKTAVAKGRYTTGDVKVAGDANLKAENIKSGVSIFGVTGSYSSAGPQSDQMSENCFGLQNYFDYLQDDGTVWIGGYIRFAWIKFDNGSQIYLTPQGGTRLESSPPSYETKELSFYQLTGADYEDGNEDGYFWQVVPADMLGSVQIAESLFIGREV